MARKRIPRSKKNKPVSISLTPKQIDFINRNSINISKFVQMILDDYINLEKDLQRQQKEVHSNNNDKEKTVK